jgi:hypothetical protein
VLSTWGWPGRPQGILEAPVELLYQAVGLRVLGGGLHVPDALDVAEAVQEGRIELAPPVGGDDPWHAVLRNLTLPKDSSTRFCRNFR